MNRKQLIDQIKDLGYTVLVNDVTLDENNELKSPVQNITISLNTKKHMSVIKIDDEKPFSFYIEPLYHIIQKDKKKKLYDLVVKYAGTDIDDRN